MRLSIDHITHYQYDEPVGFGLQQLRLTPKERPDQQIIHSWSVEVEGGDMQLHYHDHHGNRVDLIAVQAGTRELRIRCKGEVELLNEDGVIGPHRGPSPLWVYSRPTALTEAGEQVRQLITHLDPAIDNAIARAHALSALILEKLPYEGGVTNADTSAEMALSGSGGVCQDHSHIFIAAMRAIGHPARYVSGYLKMDGRDEQDATHAWAEAYFEHIGWVGFDVSNGQSPDRRYVRIATGLDYREAAPVRGMRYGTAAEALHVALQVQQ